MSNESDNTDLSSDAKHHQWNFHQQSADAARHIIAHIIESIYSRKDLTQDQKAQMVAHMQGMHHEDMAKVIDSHYSNK